MKMLNNKVYEAQKTLEKEYEYSKWRDEIPFVELPEGYMFKPIPNFTGSIVRFLAKKKGQENQVSIYLDCYDELGLVGEPYWEVYPVDGDTARFLMNDVDGLSKTIVEALDEGENFRGN